MCLKHKFGLDYACEDQRKASSKSSAISHYANLSVESFNERATSQPKAAATNGGGAVVTGLSSSVEAGINKLGLMSSSSSSSSGGQTVAPLIKDVESKHDALPVETVVVLDVCPKSRSEFRDPILLVNHVERSWRESSS